MFFVGIIASATLIIPGVSGSMLLLMMGYYNPLLKVITSFIENVTHLNIKDAIGNVFVLAPFGMEVMNKWQGQSILLLVVWKLDCNILPK